MAFEFKPLEIPEIVEVNTQVHGDERGFFAEVFKKSDFVAAGIETDWTQFNHSKSTEGVLRGLHYQLPPTAQSKLVTVTSGEILDVAVDIRKSSPTFGKWVGSKLSAEKHNALWIPAGFAHGFLTLSEEAEIIYYIAGGEYSPEDEAGIKWDDPEIGIDWGVENPTLSEKDQNYPGIKDAKHFS